MKKDDSGPIAIYFISIIFMFVAGFCTGRLVTTNKRNIQTVNNNKIEQIDKTNVKIDTEIKLLDSIKNEKIIEVKNLDNDSTLVLFYKLISK